MVLLNVAKVKKKKSINKSSDWVFTFFVRTIM